MCSGTETNPASMPSSRGGRSVSTTPPAGSTRCTPGSCVGEPATTRTVPSAARAHRRHPRERRVEVGDRAVGGAAGQAVVPAAQTREHDRPVGEHRVPGGPELPRRDADLGVDAHDGRDVGAGRVPVQVPPVGAVGHEPQRAVGVPAWLQHRLVGAARDHESRRRCRGRGRRVRSRPTASTGGSTAATPTRRRPGDRRGAATKSEPLTSTSGSPGVCASSRTISLTTSVGRRAVVALAHADDRRCRRGRGRRRRSGRPAGWRAPG